MNLHVPSRPLFIGRLLGNSGKPVTLETSSLTKFLRYVFQGQGTRDFQESRTCEASGVANTRVSGISNLRSQWSRERAIFRNLEPAKPAESRTRNFQESWTCEASGVANTRFSGILNLRSPGVLNTRKSGISHQRSHEIWRMENSGVRQKSVSEVADGGFTNQEEVKSKLSSQKVRVWSVN
jgi:hypothetical protein